MNQKNKKIRNHRYLARVVLEARTPLFVGSGNQSLLNEALVQKDSFGFPMIAGTSLAGVLRHALDNESGAWDSFFGFQQEDTGEGSLLKISAAYLLLQNGTIAEETLTREEEKLLPYFENLPLRQHVRINHRGVADQKDGGLFVNEVVYRGCRFKFELELKSTGSETEEKQWKALLQYLHHPAFRLGQGTRNGYGALSVQECRSWKFDLSNPAAFTAYLNINPSLNCAIGKQGEVNYGFSQQTIPTTYRLELTPDHYFHFGSGSADAEVALTPVKEGVISYSEKGTLKKPIEKHLIPASSIKGAIRHRTCFHYNKNIKRFAEALTNEDARAAETEIHNEAIYRLFGAEKATAYGGPQRGYVLIDDQCFVPSRKDKIFNHVAIDRFTGGASDGALFSEKVSWKEKLSIPIQLDIAPNQLPQPILLAFESALIDICKGLLPLGGLTTKGHGHFTGTLFKGDKIHYSYAP